MTVLGKEEALKTVLGKEEALKTVLRGL